MLLSSSLVRTDFVFLTWPMQPNVQRKDTVGLRPYQASNGILPFGALAGARLRVDTTVDDQVLDDESAGEAASFHRAQTVPVPGRLLVEHDVTRDNHLASAWVVEPIRLGTFLVA